MGDANNKTGVPRCPVCGKYMTLAEEGDRIAFYECCGIKRQRPKPGWRPKPPAERVQRDWS